MGFLNCEKVAYSIQALLLFLNLSKESDLLENKKVEEARLQCLDLINQLEMQKITANKGAFEVNRLIEILNQSLAIPYPIVEIDSLDSFLRGEIVAFEYYLNQELRVNHLTIQDETSLFHDSLTLWEQVGKKISAQEGILQFSLIVEQLNQLLPEQEHYPNPRKI
ncbi:MAG: hypothetical protein R3E91_00895 [Chlamydiales bacterium]